MEVPTVKWVSVIHLCQIYVHEHMFTILHYIVYVIFYNNYF